MDRVQRRLTLALGASALLHVWMVQTGEGSGARRVTASAAASLTATIHATDSASGRAALNTALNTAPQQSNPRRPSQGLHRKSRPPCQRCLSRAICRRPNPGATQRLPLTVVLLQPQRRYLAIR